MPKKGKNKGKLGGGRHRSISYGGDVRLNDFANNPENQPGPSRIKKAISNSILHEEIQLKLPDDELDWFDKDFDDICIEDTKKEKVDTGNKSTLVPVRQKKKSGKKGMAAIVRDESGNTYPPDLWHILCDYILPADVGRYASICRDAYESTQTVTFWIRLYNSYQTPVPNLPRRLQPECISFKLEGLRASVIRALYHMYAPFVDRHKINQQQEPHCLLKRKCSSTWHQKGKIMFNYFFKMEDQSVVEDVLSKDCSKTELTHFYMKLGNVFANSEKRARVLQVTSRNFISIPPTILDQTLLSVSSVLSSDLRSHNLRMVFGPSHTLQYYPKGKLDFSNIPDGSTGILLNSVVMTRILDWWSPNYPCISAEVGFFHDKTETNRQQEQPEDLYF